MLCRDRTSLISVLYKGTLTKRVVDGASAIHSWGDGRVESGNPLTKLLLWSNITVMETTASISWAPTLEYALYTVKYKVSQPCPALCSPMDCSLPGFSVHGILQARILEWVDVSFSRGFSHPREQTQISHIVGSFFTVWATNKSPIYEQVPFQECVCKSSLFLSPTELA